MQRNKIIFESRKPKNIKGYNNKIAKNHIDIWKIKK